jgi:hypothetical protein
MRICIDPGHSGPVELAYLCPFSPIPYIKNRRINSLINSLINVITD